MWRIQLDYNEGRDIRDKGFEYKGKSLSFVFFVAIRIVFLKDFFQFLHPSNLELLSLHIIIRLIWYNEAQFCTIM